MQNSDYLIVHKKILPEYFNQVIQARSLLENHEVETVTEAVKKVGISRNTYYRYKDYLSELDTPIGDGDHGGNMARGMAAVVENLEGKDFTNSAEVFQVVSMQLLSKVGGCSTWNQQFSASKR